MPASRILEGRLPEQHPGRPKLLKAQPQPQTEPERDIKGEAWAKPVASLVSVAIGVRYENPSDDLAHSVDRPRLRN